MVATLGTLDPRQQQAEQRQRMTAQQVAAEQELAKSLQHSAVTPGESLTSPWQPAAQMAQALAGRNKMNQAAAAQASLNANGPFGGASSGEAAEPPFQPSNEPGGTPGLAQGSSKFKPFSPEVKQAIIEGSQAAGVDPREMAVYAHIESDGDPLAGQHGHYKGLMQTSNEEMARVSGGKGNVWNPRDSVMAAAQIMKENKAAFTARYQQPATAFDGYMMHQQGQAGYFHHLDNPDAPAWQNMYATAEGRSRGEQWSQHAITGNGGHMSDTSGQFLGRWQQRFNNAGAGDHGAFADVAGANNPQVAPIGGPGAQVAQANIPQASAAPGASAPPSGTGAPGGAPVPGTSPGATANPPGIPPGAIRPTTQNGLMTGTIYDPAILPKPPPMPFRSMAELRNAVNRGIIGGQEAEHWAQVMQQGTQPQTMELPGGTLRWNPQNPLQQTYIPKPQMKPVKVGDIETQQQFYLDPYGRQMEPPGTAQQPAGGPPTPGATAGPPGAKSSPALSATAPGAREPFPGGNASVTDLANYGENRKVRMEGETAASTDLAKSQAATVKGARGIGVTGAKIESLTNDLIDMVDGWKGGIGSGKTKQSWNRLTASLGMDKDAANERGVLDQASKLLALYGQEALKTGTSELGEAAGRVFQTEAEKIAEIMPTGDETPGELTAKLKNLNRLGGHWKEIATSVNKHIKGGGDLGDIPQMIMDHEANFHMITPGKKEEKPAEPAAPAAAPVRRKWNPEKGVLE